MKHKEYIWKPASIGQKILGYVLLIGTLVGVAIAFARLGV